MKLTEVEAAFVDAVAREFSFLETKFDCVRRPPQVVGQGVQASYADAKFEYSNYLESDQLYVTMLFPLVGGRRRMTIDESGDEVFSYFSVSDLPAGDPDPLLEPHTFHTAAELESAVRARARVVREHMSALRANPDGVVGDVAARVKSRRLATLIPQWEAFALRVSGGFDGSLMEYIAGVNIRGELSSVLKWPGDIDTMQRLRISDADATFESATVPGTYGKTRAAVLPHPRARLWWRLPENPQGKLREQLFRPLRG